VASATWRSRRRVYVPSVDLSAKFTRGRRKIASNAPYETGKGEMVALNRATGRSCGTESCRRWPLAMHRHERSSLHEDIRTEICSRCHEVKAR